MDFKLPALPTALAEIIKIQRDATPDTNRLVAVIEKDPAIALYLLRQVNSAYYGIQKQISQINRAVMLLGSKKVYNLVLAATLKQTFANIKGPTARAVYERILQTSFGTALFARDLADHLHLSSAETIFTAGLFHQLGRLVFLYNAGDQYLPLWYQRLPPDQRLALAAPSLEAEHACFKIDHLNLGASALKRWGLPEELADIMRQIGTLPMVTHPPVRIVPLLVAFGRSLAESLFEPEGFGSFADYADNGQVSLIETLSQARPLDVDALNELLANRREAVEQYTQTMVHAA